MTNVDNKAPTEKYFSPLFLKKNMRVIKTRIIGAIRVNPSCRTGSINCSSKSVLYVILPIVGTSQIRVQVKIIAMIKPIILYLIMHLSVDSGSTLFLIMLLTETIEIIEKNRYRGK